MDLATDQFFDVIGHNFLDTIDLDVMEQTIIDDVMAEISVTEQITMTEPVNISRCKSEPAIVDMQISRTRSEPVLKKDVIEAVDAEGLLEQFEEVSQSMDVKETEQSQGGVPVFTLQTPVIDSKPKFGIMHKREISSEVIQKLKSANKPKSAVMLPLAVPAKRGKGRAMARGHPVALPASCTPRRLQRVMMQNSELKESLAFADGDVEICNGDTVDVSKVVSESVVGVNSSEVEKNNVDQNYFEHVFDHDYIKSNNKVESATDFVQEDDLDLDVEEGELIDEDLNKERNKNVKSSKNRDDLKEEQRDPAQFFDKLPSYYTALSIPRKQVRKTASCVTGRGGITVNDYFERDVSPVRDPSTYSKLPEYCSSFTNSTRYDSLVEDNLHKCNDDSKASSGYSSLTHSPDLTSQLSRSHSRSRSRSFSRSRSVNRRSRKQRNSSYSSCSGYSSSSSSCSRSSCSNSSCCRSRSQSSRDSSSRSLSCSTCCSRSSSISTRSEVQRPSGSRSRSRGHSWRRERNFRRSRGRRMSRSHRRSRETRSRSRLHSYSRSRSRYSRSRSRYSRSRSRSFKRYRSRSTSRRRERRESLERFRELRRKQREDEKEQQMKERRIVYVGGLPNKYSRHTLRDHFSRFGPIENVQLHFREHGDNYGFVTFTYTCDAFAAIEKGKKIAGLSHFDLCFGGRRQFCDVEYADLDGNKEIEEEFDSKPSKRGAMDFDELLRQAKAGIKKV